MWKSINGKTDPVNAFNNDQQVRVCFVKNSVASILRCRIPIHIISPSPVRIDQNITTDLEKCVSIPKMQENKVGLIHLPRCIDLHQPLVGFLYTGWP